MIRIFFIVLIAGVVGCGRPAIEAPGGGEFPGEFVGDWVFDGESASAAIQDLPIGDEAKLELQGSSVIVLSVNCDASAFIELDVRMTTESPRLSTTWSRIVNKSG